MTQRETIMNSSQACTFQWMIFHLGLLCKHGDATAAIRNLRQWAIIIWGLVHLRNEIHMSIEWHSEPIVHVADCPYNHIHHIILASPLQLNSSSNEILMPKISTHTQSIFIDCNHHFGYRRKSPITGSPDPALLSYPTVHHPSTSTPHTLCSSVI